MDKKIIDIGFGELNSAIILKSLSLFKEQDESPLLSGDSNEYGNFILINSKQTEQRILSGFQIPSDSKKIENSQFSQNSKTEKKLKIFDQNFYDESNCFNFMSSCRVK